MVLVSDYRWPEWPMPRGSGDASVTFGFTVLVCHACGMAQRPKETHHMRLGRVVVCLPRCEVLPLMCHACGTAQRFKESTGVGSRSLVPWAGGGASVTFGFTVLVCHACGTARGLKEAPAVGPR
jgi:hypothetical protein